MWSLDTIHFRSFCTLSLRVLTLPTSTTTAPADAATSKKKYESFLLAVAGVLVYSMVVRVAYELLEIEHCTVRSPGVLWVWVFFVSFLPSTMAPILLVKWNACHQGTAAAATPVSAPLLEECGSVPAGNGATIHDVPTRDLVGTRELALVVIVDFSQQQILLELPNDLGWRYHYGVVLPSSTSTASQQQKVDWMHSHLQKRGTMAPVRTAGTMLFTFQQSSSSSSLLSSSSSSLAMRVTVFLVEVEVKTENIAMDGRWFGFSEVPYAHMWRDDIVWLPTLLASSQPKYFEGHFVFDDQGPGPMAQLLHHNCQFGFLSCSR